MIFLEVYEPVRITQSTTTNKAIKVFGTTCISLYKLLYAFAAFAMCACRVCASPFPSTYQIPSSIISITHIK